MRNLDTIESIVQVHDLLKGRLQSGRPALRLPFLGSMSPVDGRG